MRYGALHQRVFRTRLGCLDCPASWTTAPESFPLSTRRGSHFSGEMFFFSRRVGRLPLSESVDSTCLQGGLEEGGRCKKQVQVQVQVCFTSVCGQVQPLDVALNNSRASANTAFTVTECHSFLVQPLVMDNCRSYSDTWKACRAQSCRPCARTLLVKVSGTGWQEIM
jgi:hypothetical protein